MMRLRKGRWLLGLAMGWLAASVSGHAVLASQPAAAAVEVNSFSGGYLAGRVAEVDNNLGDAITYYKKALAFDPDNKPLQQSVMLALLSEGRFEEALPYAQNLKAVPEIERLSRLTLAIDALRKEDYAAAESWLTLDEESDLDSLIAQVLIAWAKLGGGDTDGALALLDTMSGPEWYVLFVSYSKGLIAEQGGQMDIAEAAYQSAFDDVAAGGGAPDVWLRSAEAYAGLLARKGERNKALAVLDKAEELAPGRHSLNDLRERITRREDVAPFATTPADGASEHLLSLANALNRGGGEAFVRLYLQLALALKPDSDEVLVQLARVAELQEDSQRAIDFYEKVPESSPLRRVSQLQLGLNLADLDRRDEAIRQLRTLVDENPDDMRGYLALGGVYASKEDFADAGKVYDKAVERLESRRFTMPENPRVTATWNIYYQRGIAYERQKQWPKAEPNFRKALELYPDQPQVLNYLGYSWIDMNMNLEEGMEMIRKAVELRPSDGYIVDSLGWAHYRLGEYEEAVRELERAVLLMPNDPVLNDHLGDAYWQVGRKLEATFQWSHARDLEPEPQLLAEVEKKLKEGLSPPEDKAVDKAAAGPVTPTTDPVPAIEPATPPTDQRSQGEPAAEPAAAAPSGDMNTDVQDPEGQVPQEQSSDVSPVSGVSGAVVHRVAPGQSLWSIAADELGSGNRYIEILNLNPQLHNDPGRLVPGQELTLPPAGN